jgi:HEPN domain-containing protein
MRKEAEAWLKISAEDLQSAEVLFERKLFRMACYHAQQSVEKVLKALLADLFPERTTSWTSITQ